MKITLITLLTSLTLTLSAQVPDWTKYTCDGNNYNMYTELSKGKAVVLNFSSAWSAGSPAMAMESENLWQNMMSENVKVFSFLNEDQDFNEADCDDANIWESTYGITHPTFINIEDVLSTYINKYTESGATTLPWLLLFIPNVDNPAASTLVYSGNEINALNHILYDEWLQNASINDANNNKKELVKILDQLGRETSFKPNTPLIYVYSDGSTEKIFTIGE